MADSYVTSGATMKCSCGDKTAKLTVYPDRTVFLTEKPMANISDHVSMYNIAPFGKCRTTSYPPTGSATAANHGTLTPMPCVPGTISEWLQGKGDYIIKGKPALLKSSYCKCQWGGIITLTNDGQTDTGDADLSREDPIMVTVKDVPYQRNIKSHYTPEFTFNEILDSNKIKKAQKIYSEDLSRLYSSCLLLNNWLDSPFSNPKNLTSGAIEEGNILDYSGQDYSISENGETESPIVLKGYISKSDIDVDIRSEINEDTFKRESADVFLLAFNLIPPIKNTKTSLEIKIDALIAGLSLTISVGVDSNYRRYLQLEIDSWIGGDYTDLTNFETIRKQKAYKKIFKEIIKKYGRRLRVVSVKPYYSTCVPDPNYDWLDCGAYVDFDLNFDKMIQVNFGTHDSTNVWELFSKGFVKIHGDIELPGLSVEYGWNSSNVENENAGFYIQTNFIRLPQDTRPVTVVSILRENDRTNKSPFEYYSIYRPIETNIDLVAKIGSKWSYTWQLENLLEERNIPKM